MGTTRRKSHVRRTKAGKAENVREHQMKTEGREGRIALDKVPSWMRNDKQYLLREFERISKRFKHLTERYAQNKSPITHRRLEECRRYLDDIRSAIKDRTKK